MKLETLDPIRDPRWQRLVDAASGPTVFAHAAWLELLGKRYRYGMSALGVVDDGELVAGLPLARVESRLTGKRIVALPFSDVCPPLHRDGADAAAAVSVLAGALAAEREATGLDIEVRDALHGIPGAHIVPRFLVHRLALEADQEAVLARTSKSQIRRGIKKAEREGVTIEARTDRAALEAFYRLHLRTRRRQGVPIQPKGFILAFERLFALGLGRVAHGAPRGPDDLRRGLPRARRHGRLQVRRVGRAPPERAPEQPAVRRGDPDRRAPRGTRRSTSAARTRTTRAWPPSSGRGARTRRSCPTPTSPSTRRATAPAWPTRRSPR